MAKDVIARGAVSGSSSIDTVSKNEAVTIRTAATKYSRIGNVIQTVITFDLSSNISNGTALCTMDIPGPNTDNLRQIIHSAGNGNIAAVNYQPNANGKLSLIASGGINSGSWYCFCATYLTNNA